MLLSAFGSATFSHKRQNFFTAVHAPSQFLNGGIAPP
jgi:hypothetical protein